MSSFSLTNAEQLWGFFEFLEQGQFEFSQYLKQCLIPEEARTEAGLKLTSKQNYDFIELVCRDLNYPTLGWDVGQKFGAEALGSLGFQALEQIGSDVLEELSHQVQFHATGAHFFLLKQSDQWRFCNIGSVPADSYGYAVAEFYGLAVMIDLVRRSLDHEGYVPVTIGVRSWDWGIVPDSLQGADIRFEQRYLSIDLPSHAIKPRRRKGRIELHREAQSLTDKLKLLLQPHLLGSAITLNEVSRITGMSVRSIQRHLAAEQTDFRSLLQQERMALAAAQLKDSSDPVTEIAERFGYAHASHFVRAFKQIYHLTPRQFRAS